MEDDIDYVPLWFVMDEFGSRVRHSDEPTFAFKFFYFQNTATAFMVIYPIKDLLFGGIFLCQCSFQLVNC